MNNVLRFLVVILFISQLSFAQSIGNGGIGEAISHSSIKNFYIKDKRFSQTNIAGSLYINNEFLLAKLSNVKSYVQVRYDAYHDEMEVDLKDEVRYLLKKTDLKIVFKKDNITYKVYDYHDGVNFKKGFFRVFNQGKKISLLGQESIKYYKETKSKRGYNQSTPPKFKRLKDKLFISIKNSPATMLPNKKKDILKLFSGNLEMIEKYAKKNKLRFKKQEDLTKIFSYFNTL